MPPLFKTNVVQSFTRAGSWGGSGGRDPPRERATSTFAAEVRR